MKYIMPYCIINFTKIKNSIALVCTVIEKRDEKQDLSKGPFVLINTGAGHGR